MNYKPVLYNVPTKSALHCHFRSALGVPAFVGSLSACAAPEYWHAQKAWQLFVVRASCLPA
ncbi:MAG: hypothetical protein HKL95_00410 [Phycisphaerae bacterium]|nr:hypothetical protein [Phycisphaerae bacterium]